MSRTKLLLIVMGIALTIGLCVRYFSIDTATGVVQTDEGEIEISDVSGDVPETHLFMNSISDDQLQLCFSKKEEDHAQLEKLIKDLAPNLDDQGRREVSVSELCLSEIVRRGNPKWIPILESQYSNNAPPSDSADFDDRGLPAHLDNLDLLTALRRLQGKPDPLQIVVSGEKRLETIFPELPTIEVALTNLDEDRQIVGIQAGGNYRGGRQGRWRFQVRGSNGNLLPIRQQWGSMGGIFGYADLEYGETWETALNMASFIDIDDPGEYEVRVQYHNSAYLSNCVHTSGMIIHWSKPFKLIVHPREVLLSNAQVNAVKDWLHDLDPDAPVKMIHGRYGPSNYEFIPPSSPAGNILTLGWKSVPMLLDALSDDDIGANKRAWLFALLFSVTGRNDPTEADGSVMASCQWQSGSSWQIWGELKGELNQASWSAGSHGSMTSPKVSEKDQMPLVRKWLKWRDYFKLKILD